MKTTMIGRVQDKRTLLNPFQIKLRNDMVAFIMKASVFRGLRV